LYNNYFFSDEKLCDVILKTKDGGDILAHKCVLTTFSEYFEKIFCGSFQESDKEVVYIENISNAVLSYLIDFIYTGKLVTVNGDNVEVIIFLIISTNMVLTFYFYRQY
jgi:hypothetical protein